MNTRIKELRKTLKLTQEEFGSRVGVKGNTIGNYELSLRNPSDAIIHSMCREFNVNETWLRSGKGEMFLPQEDEVSEIVSHLLDESNPFYDMILDIMHTFNNLDDKGQEIICNFTSDLVDRMAKRNKQDN
ncbi:MAG: helix-turn-helix transcriptional regulator [Lachnospiraceae bacterium]|nr:helix-turn-helix transcriptional regulator [Lachnospiraceae bacterium]OKZ75004.1 MAG: transcriptional regulator [Clostridiales bacterium 36_14]